MSRTAVIPCLALIAAAPALSGCDWLSGSQASTDTQMKNVEILPGTVSDEMITLDRQQADGTAIETGVAPPAAPGAADDAETAGDEAAATDDPETQPGDVVIRPPAPPQPAPK